MIVAAVQVKVTTLCPDRASTRFRIKIAPELAGSRWDVGGLVVLGELARKLLGDPLRQHVSEHQHVLMACIVGAYVRSPVLLQSAHHLAGREVQMLLKHLLTLSSRQKRVCCIDQGRYIPA